jgi:tetratricopeptide (TPR) repeat protein
MGLGSNNIRYVGKQIIFANLGSFLLQLNQFDESIKYSKEANVIAPKYPIPHFYIGVALFQKDKTDDAIPNRRKAAELGFPKAILALQEIMGIEH